MFRGIFYRSIVLFHTKTEGENKMIGWTMRCIHAIDFTSVGFISFQGSKTMVE